MTLQDLLDVLDCHTSFTVVNVDTKELIEHLNTTYMDDVEEILGHWFNKKVDYIKSKGTHWLYIELRD